jgi:hypothetical protein
VDLCGRARESANLAILAFLAIFFSILIIANKVKLLLFTLPFIITYYFTHACQKTRCSDISRPNQ